MNDLWPAIVVAFLLADTSAHGDDARVLNVGFGDQKAWQVVADPPWWALIDMRDMLNVFHPYSIPVTGNSAGAQTTVTIPAEWQPPFALRFYCADDYFADRQAHKPGKVGTESFFDHRFKQVLVDDGVVWEQDVSDENVHGSPTIFQVDLTPHVRPGTPFKLTFRVLDRVSTSERNDRDVWFIGGTWYAGGDGKTEQAPRFHTAVWFADPVVGEKQAVEAAVPGKRPHETAVTARHQARQPLSPLGEPLKPPAELALVAPTRIPLPGFPITCGIPLPAGALRDPGQVRLLDPSGKPAPLQTSVTGLWPDGSVRWLLLHAVAPPDADPGARFRLHLDGGPGPAPAAPVQLRRNGPTVTIDTAAVQLALGSDAGKLLDEVRLPGTPGPVLASLAPRMSVRLKGQDVPVTAQWQRLEVTESGPVRACVELHGTLDAGGQHLGRFVFRLYAYAGLPSIQTQFRIFNDVKPEPYAGTADDAPLDVTDLALVAELPGSVPSRAVGGDDGAVALSTNTDSLSLLQDSVDSFSVRTGGEEPASAPGKRAQGWIATDGENGSMQASVWRFWQQFPKSLTAAGKALQIGLFTPSAAVPLYRPRFGEAKRHDVWLSFSEKPLTGEQHRDVALLADQPPRLFAGEWFCLSGGLSLMDPHWFESQPKLREWMVGQYGDFSSQRFPGRFGIRDFGDMPYNATQWLNGYWAMVQGTLNWALASGEPQWLERSIEIARHIADVDAVHIPEGHPDWKEWGGITCALGMDHSVHGGKASWPAFQIGESLMLHHWMTGDPDSRAAALANAECIIRNQAGLGSSSARCQARPMLTLLRAWEATGDVKYKAAARDYLDLKYQVQKVIDWRRGAYIEPTYENWRCISAGLDSMYAQNIYEYYRLTADIAAAQLIVAIADSVYSESMLPQEEGLGSFLFYVRYSRASWYYTQMAILFHQAYDLTGDLRFLRAGRAAFARYLLCTDAKGKPWYQPVHNFGWLDPEFGGWALHLQEVKTEPFNITVQTPAPDPANY